MSTQSKASTQETDTLIKALMVISRAVNQVLEIRATEAVGDAALSPTKVQVLRLLAQKRGQTSTQLARILGVSKPAVSQIIDAMVRSDLVSRTPAEHDRREVVLALTERGKESYKSVRREQRHLLRSAIRTTGKGSIARWSETLAQIAQALAAADRSFEQFCLQCGAHADGTCILTGGEADCKYVEQPSRKSRARKAKSSTKSKRAKVAR